MFILLALRNMKVLDRWNAVHRTVKNRGFNSAVGGTIFKSRFEEEGVKCARSLAPDDGLGIRRRLPRALLIGAMKAGTGERW